MYGSLAPWTRWATSTGEKGCQPSTFCISCLISGLMTSSITGSRVVSCIIIPATVVSRNVTMWRWHTIKWETSKHRLLTKPMKQGVTGGHLAMLTCGRRTYKSLCHTELRLFFAMQQASLVMKEEREQLPSLFPEILFESFCKDLLQGGGDLPVRLNIGVGTRISSALWDYNRRTTEKETWKSWKNLIFTVAPNSLIGVTARSFKDLC